jgi:CubicO group peptidase (beta-lactamase class C family)
METSTQSSAKRKNKPAPSNPFIRLQRFIKDLPIDHEAVLAHDMQPFHLQGIDSTDEAEIGKVDAIGPIPFDRAESFVPSEEPARFDYEDRGLSLHPVRKKRLDTSTFGYQLWQALQERVAGYVLQIRQGGKIVHSAQYQWARTPNNGGRPWNPAISMHLASISKLITAMAMVKLLQQKGIDVDSPIAPHLPTYWTIGPHVDNITFRQLLTHRSGFLETDTIFPFMKQAVANGVDPAAQQTARYRNMNFGLCRILIAIISGKVKANMYENFTGFSRDTIWDFFSVGAYSKYVQDEVFEPAGASGSLSPDATGALAYDYQGLQYGWDSGYKGPVSGGAGWHLSVNDLLLVMHEFRRGGKIVSPKNARIALNAGFGIDARRYSAAGYWWEKGGRWTTIDAAGVDRTEQCMAYFLPNDMELVVFVNSQIGDQSTSLRTTVNTLLYKNMKPWNALSWVPAS